jgi:signal transduction histidine kinase/CheY-like chemotaxis protein/HPt (histidine-containing phosphotransfer) domain-containing protein
MNKPAKELFGKPVKKSRLAVRVRTINTMLLALILILIIVIAAVVIKGITQDASVNLARFYSIESVEKFNAYMSRDLALIQKVSHSKAVRSWFADEENQEKRFAAYNEMMDYADLLQSVELYFGIHESLNEFSVNAGASFDKFVPYDKLDPANPDDVWYYECMESKNEYVLNIDVDKLHHRWRLWINHKVLDGDNFVGIFCSGLRIGTVLTAMYGQYDFKNVKGYVINKDGFIQMDSTYYELYTSETEHHIHEVSSDPAFMRAIDSYLEKIDGFFGRQVQPEVITLGKGQYGYASIAPIYGTDWSAVTLFNDKSLFSIAKLSPLLIVMLFAFVLYTIAGSFLIYLLVFVPLNRLTKSVSQAKFGTGIIFGYNRDDEIGSLAQTIHEMREILQQRDAMLQKALEKTQAANLAKTNFLSSMSHEIRTPMNAIIGMAELLLRKNLPGDARSNAHDIKQAGANLLSIINDILDVSKIEAGKLEIIPVKYLLASLVNDTVNIIRIRFKEKPIRFFTNIDGKIPHALIGDEVRLRQILINLLSNAAKYTEKGQIGLSITIVKQENKQVWLKFSVTDTGKGIKPKDQEKLFDEFVQVDTKKNRNIEGTGLGLAIVKRLCLAMGGDISVESEYGKGSAFTVIFPQEIESETPFAAVEEPLKKKVLVYERRLVYAKSVCWSLENMGVPYDMVTTLDDCAAAMHREKWFYVFSGYGLYDKIKTVMEKPDAAFPGGKKPPLSLMTDWENEGYIPNVRFISLPVQSLSIANVLNGRADSQGYIDNSGSSGMVRFTFPGARLLIVDDIVTNLNVAEGLLAPYQAVIDTCLSGEAAIELVKRNDYDIVFMDHMMPEMDGIEATAAIRAWEKETNLRKQMPIIALTANAVSGMREMFIAKGFNDFLAKPIDISKFDEMLDKWIPKEKRKRKEKNEGNPSLIPNFSLAPNSSSPDIPGVDTAKGIAMTGGTEEGYRTILSAFRKDAEERLPLLQTAPDMDNLPKLITQIHALKSASATIGATGVSAQAEKLEAAGRAKDLVFIRENLIFFAESLAELAKNIRTVLEPPFLETGSETNTGETSVSDTVSLEAASLLSDLENALVTHKASSDIIHILDELDKKPLDQKTKETLERISFQVLMTEFDNAIQTVKELNAENNIRK